MTEQVVIKLEGGTTKEEVLAALERGFVTKPQGSGIGVLGPNARDLVLALTALEPLVRKEIEAGMSEDRAHVLRNLALTVMSPLDEFLFGPRPRREGGVAGPPGDGAGSG